MVATTQERMDYVSHVALMPLALLINFSLCQYLMATYYARRREPRIMLLLACAALGFLAIIPFSHPDNTVFEYLDDISETASTLTFLIQVVVIGRDVNKKMRIRSLVYMTHVAEAFVCVELLLILASVVKLIDRELEAEWINTVVHVVEDLALWFIFFSRFFYIAMARGFKKMIATKRFEMGLYLLFATHEYPFIALETMTPGVSWQPVQALWNRLTLLFCLLHTVREKVRSSLSSKHHKTGMSQGLQTKHSVGPYEKSRAPASVTTPHRRKPSTRNEPTATTKGPSMRSIHKIGFSLRSIVPHGGGKP